MHAAEVLWSLRLSVCHEYVTSKNDSSLHGTAKSSFHRTQCTQRSERNKHNAKLDAASYPCGVVVASLAHQLRPLRSLRTFLRHLRELGPKSTQEPCVAYVASGGNYRLKVWFPSIAVNARKYAANAADTAKTSGVVVVGDYTGRGTIALLP